MAQGSQLLLHFSGHGAVVNEARWSPHAPTALISASADKTVRIWDERSPGVCSALISVPSSLMVADFLSVDWNKYEDWGVLTATPNDLLFWDLRMLAKGPSTRIPQAHRRAIKRARFSPWTPHHVATVAFDMSNMQLFDKATELAIR